MEGSIDGVEDVELLFSELGSSEVLLGFLATAMESDDDDVVLQVCFLVHADRIEALTCHERNHRRCSCLPTSQTVKLTRRAYCPTHAYWVDFESVSWTRRQRYVVRLSLAYWSWPVLTLLAIASYRTPVS